MQSKPNVNEFARTKLPWIAAGVVLVIYLLTLNRWVSIRSMPVVGKVTGWDWTLPTQYPLFYLLTYPARWLPLSIQPVALNVFAAVCGALSVGLLARSVALLPHDRTDDQRVRQRHSGALLSTNFAWAPVALAVAVLGFELTMWEHSTAATNESLNLLVFAYLIRCLLEFRISKNERWLSKLAFVYGLGVTNGYGLVAYFPLFLGALIWIRGKSFFNLAFMGRMVVLGLSGMLLYALLPAIWATKGEGLTFGESLHVLLVGQKMMVFNPVLRSRVLILSLTSILPVIIMGVRFPAGFGDVSSAGATITNTMFKLIHVVFAAAAIWVAFDPMIARKVRAGLPFLSLYYLGALAVGYYVGYLMLVSTEAPKRAWRPATPMGRLLNPLMQAAAWAAVVIAPVALMVKNFKPVRSENGKILMDFAAAVASRLPAKPAILISEDAFKLGLMEAWYSKSGANPHMMVNPKALPYPAYHRELVRRYGNRWPAGGAKEALHTRIDPSAIATAIAGMSVETPIYYLEPGFDFAFEVIHAEPNGLVAEAKRFETNMIYLPRLTAQEVTNNFEFWKLNDELVNRTEGLTALKLPDSSFVASHFSRALNKWGVELQRVGRWTEATPVFEEAISLNTNNVAARLNRDYNARRQSGKPRAQTDEKEAEEAMGLYRSWDTMLADNGPLDVPEYLSQEGQAFAQLGLLRQGCDLLARAVELDPTNTPAKLMLAKTLVNAKWHDEALRVIADARASTNTTTGQRFDLVAMEAAVYFGRQETNRAEATLLKAVDENPNELIFYESLSEMYRASGQVDKALGIMDREIALMPTNVVMRLRKVDVAISAGRTNLADSELKEVERIQPSNSEARSYRAFLFLQEKDFKKALATVDLVLQDNDKNSQALTYKGIIQMEMKEDEKAIESFTKALKADGGNIAALRNRAIVNLRANHLADAKRDYDILLANLPKSHAIYYGLGEIAYRKKDRAEAIKNFESYLSTAPTNGTPELEEERKKVQAQLNEMKAGK